MPAGPVIVPQRAHINLFNATALLSTNAAQWRLALMTSAWVPNDATDELFGDISSNEIAGANGYSSGGFALTGVTLSLVAGNVRFTSAQAQWTATGGSIAAWRRAALYYLGTVNGKLNPLLGHFLGDQTNIDVPATTVGNPLTITPNANGWVQSIRA